MNAKTLLIELGTEELPPRALDDLAAAFARGVADGLNRRGVAGAYAQARTWCTPRRLAVAIPDVAARQPAQKHEVLGPYLNIGLAADGTPTPALLGFAAKNGVAVEQLQRLTDAKGERFVARSEKPGQATAALVPEIVREALAALPIPKPMRWGSHDYAFVRPVHWLVMLHGADVIDGEVLGVRSGRASRGHRFHHPQPVHVADADSWLDSLRAAKVLADPVERAEKITSELFEAIGKLRGATGRSELAVHVDVDNLEEVKNLVEWPVAIICGFESAFLDVPQEALIQTMQKNQKFFPVLDGQRRLTEHFIGVANIESSDPSEIRKGYERVIRPRFADAKFFFEEDRKQPLAQWQDALKSVTYQQALGSVWDKCVRVAELARVIANRVGVDAGAATRAAALAKCDLMSRMVGEFPELQGVMGRYYASAHGESADIAQALDEFYAPRFGGDAIARGKVGQVLAVAERLDTLAGIFAVGMKPSGNKDPFALRRAALGLARTLIEGGLDIDLPAQLAEALDLLPASARQTGFLSQKALKAGLQSPEAEAEIAAQKEAGLTGEQKQKFQSELYEFILDRLRGYYTDQGIAAEAFEAVRALAPASLLDFDRRLRAVVEFARLPDAAALAAANKRIGNLLRQYPDALPDRTDTDLLQQEAERALHGALQSALGDALPLIAEHRYVELLRRLAHLRAPVDAFFDAVMVMAEDPALRRNRVGLLAQLRRLFLQVADVSLLPAA